MHRILCIPRKLLETCRLRVRFCPAGIGRRLQRGGKQQKRRLAKSLTGHDCRDRHNSIGADYAESVHNSGLMNKLKPMITEPWLTIREMYRPSYTQPNRLNFLFLTNHDDAIILDENDRRYCILDASAGPHPNGQKGYYKHLFKWTKENAPALAHYFQHRDLSDFEPKAHAPMTDAKGELIEESRLPLETTIEELVENYKEPFCVDLVLPSDVAPKMQKLALRADPKAVGKAFRKLGFQQIAKSRFHQGSDSKQALYVVRNYSRYAKLTAEQLRDFYQKQNDLNQRRPGDPSDKDILRQHQQSNQAGKPKVN